MGAEQSTDSNINDTNSEMVSDNSKFQSLKDKLLSKADNIDDLAKLLSENNDNLNTTIDSYLAKVENNESVIQELKQQLKQREDALITKSDQILSIKDDLDNSKELVSKLTRDNEELNAKLESFRENITLTDQNRQELIDEEEKKLRGEIDDLKRQIQLLEEEKEENLFQIANLQKRTVEIQKMYDDIYSLENEFNQKIDYITDTLSVTNNKLELATQKLIKEMPFGHSRQMFMGENDSYSIMLKNLENKIEIEDNAKYNMFSECKTFGEANEIESEESEFGINDDESEESDESEENEFGSESEESDESEENEFGSESEESDESDKENEFGSESEESNNSLDDLLN